MANSETKASGDEVIVVGAGIVGTCCALYLRREGFAVTLIDRDGPGEACSFGNGGNLAFSSCVPLSLPGVFLKAPRMLVDPAAPLAVRWGHLPRALPWFLRFLRNSTPARVEEIADARIRLLKEMFAAYAPLLADAGAQDLMKHNGLLYVFESERSYAESGYALELRRRRGVEMEELSGDEVREREPALAPSVKRGVFMPQVAQTANPLRLTQKLAECFVRNGGVLRRETVRGFEMGPRGPRRVVTDAGGHDFDQVVIAAGAWSRPLAAELGCKVPLEAEWGYHAMLPDPRVRLRVAVVSADRVVGITPMEEGVRVVGVAEFAGLDAPPDYRRADVICRLACGLIPGLNAEGASRWKGPRPSMPDSRPVIGRAPRHPNVLFAFGHDHIGLALAAITGKLIGELAAGRPPSVDIGPYRPDRF